MIVCRKLAACDSDLGRYIWGIGHAYAGYPPTFYTGPAGHFLDRHN